MNIYKLLLIILFFIPLGLPLYGQENPVVLKRTPEQEAAKQTEKLQQELELNQTQANQVYEINLRYARERQVSNKRSEALQRTKNKNDEIRQVLSSEQNERLENKRYERTYIETYTLNRNQPVKLGNTRTSPGFRSNQKVRVPASTDMNLRTNNRPVNPDYQPRQGSDQPTRRNTSTAPRSNQLQNNQMPTRSFNSPQRSQPSVNPNRKQ